MNQRLKLYTFDTIFKPINSSWHQNQTHKSKFIQAHTDIKRLLQILILPQVYHTLESTAYNIYHCRHSWRFQEHDPSISLDSNFHTIITHSNYQMYIVLTFELRTMKCLVVTLSTMSVEEWVYIFMNLFKRYKLILTLSLRNLYGLVLSLLMVTNYFFFFFTFLAVLHYWR
jgi:hypothetical protein